MSDIILEVIRETPTIEGYRAVGAAVFEIYSDGMVKLLGAFNPGYTAADMAAAVASAERYAANLNQAWAF
jgi:hypothetical protein